MARAAGVLPRPFLRKVLDGLTPALLALALAPQVAFAQSPVHAPCLAAQPDLEGYREAFESEGWSLAVGEARDLALRGPSEHLFTVALMPDVAQTLEELESQQARAHEWAREQFADALVLTKGDMAVAVDILEAGPDQRRLRCILTAPKLGEVGRMLGNAEPSPFGGITIRVIFPYPLPGTSDLQIEAVRATRAVTLSEPLPGTEALVVGANLEPQG